MTVIAERISWFDRFTMTGHSELVEGFRNVCASNYVVMHKNLFSRSFRFEMTKSPLCLPDRSKWKALFPNARWVKLLHCCNTTIRQNLENFSGRHLMKVTLDDTESLFFAIRFRPIYRD